MRQSLAPRYHSAAPILYASTTSTTTVIHANIRSPSSRKATREKTTRATGVATKISSPPQLVILGGLLILVATPVARVVFSLVAFLLEGDRMFAWITVVVLVVLAYSIGAALW